MYAVFRTGGKQFRVEPGSKLRVPTLEAEEGTTVSFDQVLIASDGSAVSVGLPTVAGASVKAEVLRHGKDRKIIVFKRGAYWWSTSEGAYPLSAALESIIELGGWIETIPNPNYRARGLFG